MHVTVTIWLPHFFIVKFFIDMVFKVLLHNKSFVTNFVIILVTIRFFSFGSIIK